MVSGNMCCGVVNDTLMARVGVEQYLVCLDKNHVREMNFTGNPLKGFIYVDPEAIETDDELKYWVDTCLTFVLSLAPK